jgi:hypothetical protein
MDMADMVDMERAVTVISDTDSSRATETTDMANGE